MRNRRGGHGQWLREKSICNLLEGDTLKSAFCIVSRAAHERAAGRAREMKGVFSGRGVVPQMWEKRLEGRKARTRTSRIMHWKKKKRKPGTAALCAAPPLLYVSERTEDDGANAIYRLFWLSRRQQLILFICAESVFASRNNKAAGI